MTAERWCQVEVLESTACSFEICRWCFWKSFSIQLHCSCTQISQCGVTFVHLSMHEISWNATTAVSISAKSSLRLKRNPKLLSKGIQIKAKGEMTDCETYPELYENIMIDWWLFDLGCYSNLLALVESSLEVLLMLALLSRFFLQSVSLCLVWLEDGGDEEELVLARESSSDIPVWIGEEPGPEAESMGAKRAYWHHSCKRWSSFTMISNHSQSRC